MKNFWSAYRSARRNVFVQCIRAAYWTIFRHPPAFLAGLGVLALCFAAPWDTSLHSVWLYRWHFATLGLVALASLRLGLPYTYFTVAACAALLIPWLDAAAGIQAASRLSAAMTLIVFLAAPHLWLCASQVRPALILCAWPVALLGIIFGNSLYAPVLHNPSLAASFVVLVALATKSPWLLLLSAAFTLKSWAWMPAVTLTAGLYILIFRSIPAKLVAAALLGIAGVAVYFQLPDPTTGRLPVWQLALEWWSTQNIWLGSGAGSTATVLPTLQASSNIGGSIFYTLHNDWLQILFEFGLVGLVCALSIFWRALQASRGTWVQAALFAYGINMLGNSPLHSPLTAVLGIYILGVAFGGRRGWVG